MKKIYSALILCCLNVAAFAQTMIGVVNAVGSPGSYKTGYAEKGSPSLRIDGDLQAHHALTAPVGDRRGWAVFNLNNVVPVGASVQSVNLRFTISGVTDVNPSTVGIYGYVGDLSTITDADQVFAGCNGNGIYTGSNFNGTSWGASAATLTLPFNSAGVGFINTNAPGYVTIGWQSNSNSLQTYTITGENGTLATQPQLEIVYTCNGVSSVTAAASPGTLCNGTSLSLTSTGTGVSSWEWQGPDGFISTSANPTHNVTMASAGIYTLTAFNADGCGTLAYTTPVTVNPLPAAITGGNMVCIGPGTTITLSDVSGAGTWTSGNPAVATVNLTTGVVGGVAPGTTNITFTLSSTGCKISTPVIAQAVPTAISGASRVCLNGTVTLSEAVMGGTWSSSNTSIATISNSGVISTNNSGTVTITYANGCAPAATHIFTVNPIPADISGGNWVCSGSNLNLTETSTGGTWSSQFTSVATVSSTGQVHGVATGATAISYVFPTGCYAVKTVTVNPTPPAIVGATICAYDSVQLYAYGFPGAWSSLSTTLATVDATGWVKGKAAGSAVIKFTTSCNVVLTTTVTLKTAPAPILGIRSVCNGLTTYLTDITTPGTWSSANPAIAAVPFADSGRIFGNTVGVTNITYTSASNGCFATASFTVTGPPPPSPIDGVGTVCVGQTIQLSQVTGVGWWTSSNTTLATVNLTNGVVRGQGMGLVNITYSIGSMNNCTTWKTIQVHPLDPITGPDSVCHGTTTYLADIVGGGTWTSTTTTVATIGSTTGFVQSITPGVTTITYTTPQGCITSKNLTVIAIPPPITGPLKTCPGQNIMLSNANPGGRWTTSNTTIATAQTVGSGGRITGVGPDTVTVTYTVRPGCSTSTIITVNPNPAPITGTNGICATTRDTVFDATAGGTWSISPTSFATIDTNGIIYSVSPGTVNISYTLPVTGCYAILTVPVRPLPVSTITYVNSVNTLYADSGYVSYQWYGTLEGLIPGATSLSIAGLETQGYYVVVTDEYGCVGTSAVFPYDVHMGVSDPEGSSVRIFPNPATSVVRIEWVKPLRAVITTLDGKTVLEKANAREINISSLADGMYFVVLYNDRNQAIATRKLVKQ